MKKVITLFTVFVFFSVLVLNQSCKPDDPEPQPQDTTKTVLNEQTVSDGVSATDVYTDVIADVLVKTDENSSNKKSFSEDYPIVTLEPTIGYPKTLTIDYGTAGCDVNGHTIKGKVIAKISDRLRTEGTTVSISFTTFSVDTLTIDGTVALTIDEVDLVNSTIKFSTTFTTCSVTMPSGTISLAGSLSYTWNINTLTDYEDDTFDITSGSLTGTNREGKSFTGTVLTTLVYTVQCKTIVSGTLKLETSDNNFPATIDFGDGTCDKKAIVYTTIEYTIGNQTFTKDYSYEITLP